MVRNLTSTLFTCTLAFTSLVGCAEHRGPRGPVHDSEAIYVVGRGQAAGQPDRVRLNLGVEAKGEKLEDVMKDATARMNKVRAALLERGVTESDVQTGQFSISQIREPLTVSTYESAPVTKGAPSEGVAKEAQAGTTVVRTEERWVDRYLVSNTLIVKSSDLPRVGALISSAVEAGANSSFGLSFELEDPRQLDSQAREEALLDARAKAEQLAKTTGVKLGRVLAVHEVGSEGSGGSSPYPMAKAMAFEAVPIEPGSLERTVQVQLAYEIER